MKSEAEILKLNQQQKQFYNSEQDSKHNFVTKIWANFRNGVLNNFRTKFNLKDKVYQQHKLWFGDLSSKKVLDLGCLRGNALSIYMAQNAKQYVGIDLSDKAISILNEKLVICCQKDLKKKQD